MDDRRPRPYLSLENVNLHLAEPDGGHDRAVDAECTPGQHDRPGEQLFRREGHGQDVSTPRSNALSVVGRSPRRVRPSTGVELAVRLLEAPSRWSNSVLSS